MTAFSLQPRRKADDDEDKAKQQTDHHAAPITGLKAEDSFCSPGTNRGCVFRRRCSLKILLPRRFFHALTRRSWPHRTVPRACCAGGRRTFLTSSVLI